jgi:hypothetical protein
MTTHPVPRTAGLELTAPHDEQKLHLCGRDVAMSWILAAMIAFGGAVGITFPAVVSSIVDVHPGDEGTFRIACILAGFFVAGFAYGIARFTLYRANRRLAQLAAFDSLTGLLNRREFVRTLDVELARALREGHALSLNHHRPGSLQGGERRLRARRRRRGVGRRCG